VILASLLLSACGDGQAERASSGPTSPASVPDTTPSPRQQAQAPTATTRAATATRTATRTAATPAVTRTPAQTPTPIPPPEPAIGDTIETDGWKLTIIGFDLYQLIDANERRLGNEVGHNATAKDELFPALDTKAVLSGAKLIKLSTAERKRFGLIDEAQPHDESSH